MNISFRNLATAIVGASFIVIGTTATPSQATTLTGFKTTGNMMSGMQVKVGFLDGSYEIATWGATSSNSGGAFGTGWSLTQRGDTYGYSSDNNAYGWTFSYSGGNSLNSLLIDAISGNAVFDRIRSRDSEYTPNSADGWNFEVLSGKRPDNHAYSVPIDISRGDLFGRLAMVWNSGFNGTMTFIADTDSGTTNDPVKPLEPAPPITPPPPPPVIPPPLPPVIPPPPPPPPNVAPIVSLDNYTINEGQSVSPIVYGSDANNDPLTFWLNGNVIGSAVNTAGGSSVTVPLGTYVDEGTHALTAQVQDDKGETSVITRTLTVLNVAPTINRLTRNITIKEGDRFNFAARATDPGINDILTYNWDLDNNGQYDNRTGIRGRHSFADEGSNPIKLQVSDGDGGYDYGSFNVTVENVAPTITRLTQNLTIKQGESFDFAATATDPGIYDILRYRWDLDGDGRYDDYRGQTGKYAYTDVGVNSVGLRVADGDGGFDFGSFNVTVENVAPTITSITKAISVLEGELFDFGATATDPGINDLLSFAWDLDDDGEYDDFFGTDGQWSFNNDGVYNVKLKVSDGNNGFTYSSFDVAVEHVPEPSSAFGLLAFGAVGAGIAYKRKHQRKI
ncbi:MULTISPECIES: PKD domain-containing protein [Cyanophyceae]|uniref:PKD domain-containing protein n=1 Tax=Cyanophyceae TaxID=3028117 RepID=UPI0016898C98|nr:PKD domain-containing protein [Trichocoleus sp. FACHB-69]MBD1930482.1 PKD domain-containing protein [Trichocoleus sp. FACHB-69]